MWRNKGKCRTHPDHSCSNPQTFRFHEVGYQWVWKGRKTQLLKSNTRKWMKNELFFFTRSLLYFSCRPSEYSCNTNGRDRWVTRCRFKPEFWLSVWTLTVRDVYGCVAIQLGKNELHTTLITLMISGVAKSPCLPDWCKELKPPLHCERCCALPLHSQWWAGPVQILCCWDLPA